MTGPLRGPDGGDVSAARLESPAFARNGGPILDVLRRVLVDRDGVVLEVGSGPGQHVAAFAAALPRLTWQPSDIDPTYRESIEAWRQAAGLPNLEAPIALDATAADWPSAGGLTAMLCINVLHIAPWSVAEGLMRAAGRLLAADGRLILYGPYARDGAHTSPGNAAFDVSLKAQDPHWGVRDTRDIARSAATQGLAILETVEMPANNLCLVLARGDRIRRR